MAVKILRGAGEGARDLNKMIEQRLRTVVSQSSDLLATFKDVQNETLLLHINLQKCSIAPMVLLLGHDLLWKVFMNSRKQWD